MNHFGAAFNESVDQERQTHHHEESADADCRLGVFVRERDQHHQPESDAHQRDAGAAMAAATAGAVVVKFTAMRFHALEAPHRAIESWRIGFGGGDETALDHRDAFLDLELAHARARERFDDAVCECADDGDDRDREGSVGPAVHDPLD